ncbi:MAG: type II secretion system protein, partial [Phycisphaerae bacterium]|nr:type II secretion system protein [Phycisphaerae bacterium]
MRSMNGANLVSRAGRADRAFTLVEMLVAVGAVALVSVGLAAVFQTVGRTVTTGKRVSALTQQAAVLESQMREDFKNMSREGILVIRHQYTLQKRQGANAQELISVSRFQGDPVPARPRRIDEIMFFANGEYQTSREDLIPGRAARSRAARIYYGHGQKATPRTPDEERNFQVDVKYNNPTFGDLLNDLDNISDRLGEFRHGNVNRYASSWNLIRHATLLARPASVTDGGWPEDRPVPAGWGTGATLTNLCSDSTFQIAGQPAANSIFRSINEMFPMAGQQSQVANAKKFALFWDDMTSVRAANSTPRVGSGVVDIAATDLDEVSMVVNGSFYSPGDKVNRGSDYFAGRTSGFGLLEAPMPLMNGWIGA